MVEKKRHWFLTSWLWFLILMDLLKAWYYFVYLPIDLHAHNLNVPGWVPASLGVIFLGNVFCIYGLFKWSIWGFWGYCLLKIMEIYIKATSNFGTVGHLIMAQGVLILILIYTLNLGGDKKAWKQLHY